ncbi:MAG: hypothetical protein ACC619_10220, partial [Paracoccaceae bacterium]
DGRGQNLALNWLLHQPAVAHLSTRRHRREALRPGPGSRGQNNPGFGVQLDFGATGAAALSRQIGEILPISGPYRGFRLHLLLGGPNLCH